MAHDTDPFSGYNFMVALSGSGGEEEIAGGFQEVLGLSVSIDEIEYRVGNEKPSSVRKFAGLRRFSHVTLRRGLLTDMRLWEWIATDPPDKRTVVITLLDEQRVARVRFVLRQAWPVKWTGPDLNAQGSDAAIESIELTHEGLEVSAG
jgi:phage tail-like protein